MVMSRGGLSGLPKPASVCRLSLSSRRKCTLRLQPPTRLTVPQKATPRRRSELGLTRQIARVTCLVTSNNAYKIGGGTEQR
jgi:hypothetical protein